MADKMAHTENSIVSLLVRDMSVRVTLKITPAGSHSQDTNGDVSFA